MSESPSPQEILCVSVRGLSLNKQGTLQAFSFNLICKRLSQIEVNAELANKTGALKDFLLKVAIGWEDVLDDRQQPLKFDADVFSAVLEKFDLHFLCFTAYLQAAGVEPFN